MGIRSTLELLKFSGRTSSISGPGSFAPTGMLSPWQTGELAQIVIPQDVFGVATTPLTRLEALRVPAIAKARSVLHSVIRPRPLRDMSGNDFIDKARWLYRSDTGIAPQQRTADILDDLIFEPASLLVVERGAGSPGAAFDPILDAVHVPFERWAVDGDGQIRVDGVIMPSDSVIVIYGPGPGLLHIGGETIRGSRDMQSSWAGRVRTPIPALLLKELEEGRIGDEQKAAYAQAIAEARRNPNGAVMVVPFGLEAEALNPSDDSGLYIEGRNAIRIDVANYFNMPAALLDGSLSTASLTYSTQEGKRNELYDLTVPYWTGPIEDALSLDNVCPRGQRIRFDFTDLIAPAASPTGPVTED